MANTKPIKWLRNILGNKFFPVTHMKAVRDDNGNTLSSALTNINEQISTKYTKLSNGIPKTDLTSDVLTSLDKADTALQSYTETDPTVPSHVKSITTTDISNWNNKLSTAPVTSVNGLTGVVNLTIPATVTESTVSDWGFTKNNGTVTSVTLNATSPIAIDSSAAITTSGTRTISHANSGVTVGTYKSVTVDAKGHVTGGTNPTTLSGYGITDAINTSSTALTKSGNLTAAKFITNGGTSSLFVKGDGSLDASLYIKQSDTNFTNMTPFAINPLERGFNGTGWYRIYRGSGSTCPIHIMLFRSYNSPAPEGYDLDIETPELNDSATITVVDDDWGIATITQNAGFFTGQEMKKIRIYGYNGAPSTSPNNPNKALTCIDIYINDTASYTNAYKITGYSAAFSSGSTINKFYAFTDLTSDDIEYLEFCQGKNNSRYYIEFDLAEGFKTNKQAIASAFKKLNGTSSQFLKADGSVDSNTYLTSSSLSTYAPLASPALTGTPTAPTAANGTKTNQIATTCFVQKAVSASAGSDVNWNNDKSCLTKTLNGTTTSIVNATTIAQAGAPSIIADASCTCAQKNRRAYSARYIDCTFATIADVEENERVTAEALADLEGKLPLIVHFTNENDTWTADTSIIDIAAAAGEGRTVWGEFEGFGNLRASLVMHYETGAAIFEILLDHALYVLVGQINNNVDVWTFSESSLPSEFKTINNTSIIGSGSISLPTTERVDEIEETTAAALNELNNNKLSWDDTTNILDQSTNLPTSSAVYSAIQTAIQGIPTPMQFKGSLGTGGTYTASTLPAASSTNKGWTVKVITAGTYRSVAANIGDVLVSDGSAWVLIPSGDEPSGTVTSVGLSMPTGFTVSSTPVTTSGTISVTMTSGYAIPTTTQVTCWNNKVSNVLSDWNATSGSAVILNKPTVISSIGYNSPGGYLTANNSNAVQLTVCSSDGRKLNIGGSSWLFTSTTEPSASADKSTIAPTWSAMTSAISGKATAVSATAGTYRSVTVNSQGLVTSGTNPTTLSGYGITDAKIANGVITLGSNTITPLTSHQTLKTINSTAITGSGNISIPVVANFNAPNSLPTGATGTGVTISSTNYYLVSDKPYCTSSDVNVAPSWSAIQSCLSAVRTEMGSSTGGVTIYSGSSTPSSSLGSNGDIYIQTS